MTDFPCDQHPDRESVAYLYWEAGDDEEGLNACSECLLPKVNDLYETLQDIMLCDPEIMIRPI